MFILSRYFLIFGTVPWLCMITLDSLITQCTYNQYISKMAVTLTLIAACIQYVVVVVYFFNIHNLFLEIMINIYNKFVKILKNICFQTRSSTQGIYVRRGKVRIIIVRSMILPLVPYCCTYLTTLYCHT